MKYRADIDGLRSVAVLPVIFYHAGLPGPSGGFVGVDVFFVISGFLITTIVAREIAEERFSLILFYERRARRILPALMLVVMACLLAGWFALLPAEMENLGESVLATALFVSNLYFAIKLDYFGPAAETVPLLHTWSLAVEEQFYLFFPPLLMLLAWRHFLKPAWIILGLSILSFVAAVVFLPSKPDWVFYLIFFRAWELGAGALVALTIQGPPTARPLRELLALAGVAGILIPVFVYDSTFPFPAAAALPPVIGATLIIWIGSAGVGSFVNTFLSHRVLVWIGLISYSLYLWHWPILAFLKTVLGTANLSIPVACGALLLSLALAWLSFRFVERPFRKQPPYGPSRFLIFSASAVSIVVAVSVGIVINLSAGFPARVPAEATAIASFATDKNPRREECLERSPSLGLCSIGIKVNEGDRVDFLFWGDSHADAFMPGMDKAASLSGRSGVFAGRAGCLPVFGIQKTRRGPGCTSFNQNVWTWLKERTDVPLVILAARWTISIEGSPYRGEAGEPVIIEWIGEPEQQPDTSSNAAFVEAGLRATVTKILASGRKVILMGPVPEAGQDVPMAFARKTLFNWASVPIITRKDYEARAGKTERILLAIAEANDGVNFVPLSDLFCDAQLCQFTNDDGLPLYIDDDHINRTAALERLPKRLKGIFESEQN